MSLMIHFHQLGLVSCLPKSKKKKKERKKSKYIMVLTKAVTSTANKVEIENNIAAIFVAIEERLI